MFRRLVEQDLEVWVQEDQEQAREVIGLLAQREACIGFLEQVALEQVEERLWELLWERLCLE